MSFIYVITNILNNKQYVGQTSRTIEERFQQHIWTAKNEKCRQSPIYRAMRKYGIEKFTISKLEECKPEDADEKEIYWIAYLNTYENGYNANLGGRGTQKPLPPDKEVIDFYFNCEENTKKTAEYFNICTGSVRKILKINNIKIHKDKNYNYQEIAQYYLKVKNVQQTMLFFKCSSEVVKRACSQYNVKILSASQSSAQTNSKPVYQRDKSTGEIIQRYNSAVEAAKALGNEKWKTNISACCRGKQKTAYGYRWTYSKEEQKNFVFNDRKRPVLQFNSQTLELIKEFDSVASAAEEIGGLRESKYSTCIASCARNDYKTAYGFAWLYKDLYEQGIRKG